MHDGLVHRLPHDSHFPIVRNLLTSNPKLLYLNTSSYLQKASLWQ